MPLEPIYMKKKKTNNKAIAILLAIGFFTALLVINGFFFSNKPLKEGDNNEKYDTIGESTEIEVLEDNTIETIETIEKTQKQTENTIKEEVEINNNYYLVNRVIDGDTIEVKKNNELLKVRLIGIDTPETYHKTKGLVCYGEEASEEARRLLNNKTVRLEADDTQDDKDIYDRLLRYVFVDDIFVNLELIKNGFAREYTFRGSEYKHQNTFKGAEKNAIEAKKGLWNDCY